MPMGSIVVPFCGLYVGYYSIKERAVPAGVPKSLSTWPGALDPCRAHHSLLVLGGWRGLLFRLRLRVLAEFNLSLFFFFLGGGWCQVHSLPASTTAST